MLRFRLGLIILGEARHGAWTAVHAHTDEGWTPFGIGTTRDEGGGGSGVENLTLTPYCVEKACAAGAAGDQPQHTERLTKGNCLNMRLGLRGHALPMWLEMSDGSGHDKSRSVLRTENALRGQLGTQPKLVIML